MVLEHAGFAGDGSKHIFTIREFDSLDLLEGVTAGCGQPAFLHALGTG